MKTNILLAVILVFSLTAFFSSCQEDKDDLKLIEIVSISIKDAPLKTDYYLSEVLDLSGFIISLNYNNGESEEVANSDFKVNGITCNPENGIKLTTPIKEIIVTHDNTLKQVKQSIVFNTLSDIDGNIYQLVKIGNQIWMEENLKTSRYSDGTEIALIEDNTSWANLSDNNEDKAFCYYNNNLNNEKNTYGALYTYAAAMNGANSSSLNPSDIQGVCPTGWHLPSDAEWTELTDFLGGENVAYDKLREIGTEHWIIGLEDEPELSVTNESGFTALPSGFRNSDNGEFYHIEFMERWWSSTEVSSDAVKCRLLARYRKEDLQYDGIKSSGIPVRCVKD